MGVVIFTFLTLIISVYCRDVSFHADFLSILAKQAAAEIDNIIIHTEDAIAAAIGKEGPKPHIFPCKDLDYAADLVYNFPGDLGNHLDQRLEWWWVMSTINTTDGNTYGIGIFITRMQLYNTCGLGIFSLWNYEFTLTDPQATGDAQHQYYHRKINIFDPLIVSATNNYTTGGSVLQGGSVVEPPLLPISDICNATILEEGIVATDCPTQPPPFRILGKLHGKTFYDFQQDDMDPTLFRFNAVAMDDVGTFLSTSIKNLELRDIHGAQPISSAGMISPYTTNGTVTTTIELDQSRMRAQITPGHEPEITVNGVTHKISDALVYNSHQWLTNHENVTTSSYWIWFWLGLFDEDQTTITICRLPPYGQHVAANVITVSQLSKEPGVPRQRMNRVFAANHDILFNASKPWKSPRSNNTYYTQHHFRIIPASLDLHIESFVADSEFGYKSFEVANKLLQPKTDSPSIYYYEGAGKVWGTKNGQPVVGVGNIETYGDFYDHFPAQWPPA